MKIDTIEIQNYRNLDGLKLVFDPVINFLVGETNLGKSNFLSLLDTIFNKTRFEETDFNNTQSPIEISFRMILDDIEKGLFEDLFDPSISDKINIIAKQENIDEDEYIRFYHKESGTDIQPRLVKNANYIYYDSLRDPKKELRFDKRKGAGRFLSHIFNKYLESEGIEDIDFINKEDLNKLLDFINRNLIKIKSFQDFSISADLEENTNNVLVRIVTLKDEDKINLQNSGQGIQFLSLICLTIFEKLLDIKKFKRDKSIFQDNDGKKYISLLLGLDEPEIHLHPYMQRSLIKYILNIIGNREAGFMDVIADFFLINRFIGQIIICTHSPNILLSNYKEIVRFYKNSDNKIIVKNGKEISLGEDVEKHLLKNMPYIKEAFFSKCVILVEGDTELGAFPTLASKLGIDLDDYGISVIQAGSAESIPPLMKMLSEFGVNNVGLMDKDKYDVNKEKYEKIVNLHSTDKQDFEEEIVSTCFEKSKEIFLKEFIKKNDTKGLNRLIDKNKFNTIIKKYKIDIEDVQQDQYFNIDNNKVLYPLFLAWLDINKSIILGRTIAEDLPKELIPQKFKNIIDAAVEVSRNA